MFPHQYQYSSTSCTNAENWTFEALSAYRLLCLEENKRVPACVRRKENQSMVDRSDQTLQREILQEIKMHNVIIFPAVR